MYSEGTFGNGGNFRGLAFLFGVPARDPLDTLAFLLTTALAGV